MLKEGLQSVLRIGSAHNKGGPRNINIVQISQTNIEWLEEKQWNISFSHYIIGESHIFAGDIQSFIFEKSIFTLRFLLNIRDQWLLDFCPAVYAQSMRKRHGKRRKFQKMSGIQIWTFGKEWKLRMRFSRLVLIQWMIWEDIFLEVSHGSTQKKSGGPSWAWKRFKTQESVHTKTRETTSTNRSFFN